LDVFHTLAEIAVAITGFSSLIIIFRGGAVDWSRQDYVSFAFALSWSIGSIFLALLPIVLVEFGITMSAAAQIGLFCAVAYMFVVGAVLTYARIRISEEGQGSLRSSTSVGMSVLWLVIVTAALAAGFGLLPGALHAWYAATIVLLMVHATAELGIFVVQTIRQPELKQAAPPELQ
jgi:hypothetical protein